MANTSSQDAQLTRLNTQLTEFQNEKGTLEAVQNPNQHITDAINKLEGHIQRIQRQIANANVKKQNIIDRHATVTARNTDIENTFGVEICAIVEKYI